MGLVLIKLHIVLALCVFKRLDHIEFVISFVEVCSLASLLALLGVVAFAAEELLV